MHQRKVTPLTGLARALKAKQKRKNQAARRSLRMQKKSLPQKALRKAKHLVKPTTIIQQLPYILLLMVVMNEGVSLASRINSADKPISNGKDKPSNKKSGSSSRIFKLIKASCMDTTFETMNKPPVRIGVQGGKLDYQSCIEGDPIGCLADHASGKQHNPVFDIQSPGFSQYNPALWDSLEHERNATSFRYKEWKKQVKQELEQLDISDLSPQQINQFNANREKVQTIQQAKMTTDYTRRIRKVRCGEMSNVVVDDARQAASRYPTDSIPPLQQINLEASEFDHTFLIVNGTNPLVKITNNLAEARGILNRMNGIICDRWNAGLFTNYSENANGLYSGNYPWHTVEIINVPLALDLRGLPSRISDFFQRKIFPEIRQITIPETSHETENAKIPNRKKKN